MSVVTDALAYLVAEGHVDGSSSWPSSPRLAHDDSDRLVVLLEDGGPPPELGGGSFDGASSFPGLQVRVRGAPHEGEEAATKAEEILEALHGLTGTVLGATTYEGVYAMTSAPVWLGYDASNRPEFTVSFRLMTPLPA